MVKPTPSTPAFAETASVNEDRSTARGGVPTLIEELATPLRDEVAGRAGADKRDRQLRRSLDEVLYDCEHGLTDHTARRCADELTGNVSAWFDRRREAEASRNAEMAAVIAGMGKALKTLHGDDADFFAHIDETLRRLRGAADSSSVRSASARLNRLLGDLGDGLAAQREASEKRVRQLSGMVQGLHSELHAAKVQLAEDALTGLYNRGSFDAHLGQALARARLAPYRFTLIMVDLDHFKSVNDTHGHVGGDRVLKKVAEILSRLVFRSTDLVARYGGEEMAIVLDDSGAERGANLAEKLRTALEAHIFDLPKAAHRQTASFGVAEGSEKDTAESLIQRADECLYLAKRNGRNQVVTAGWGQIGRRVGVPRGLPCEPRKTGIRGRRR